MTAAQLVLGFVYLAVLVAVSYTDLKERRIPNRVIVPAIVLALIAMFYQPGWRSALPAAALAAFITLIPVFAFGGHGGMGDVKLAFFIGLILGLPDTIYALLLAYLSTSILWVGVFIKKLDRKSLVPFGPFLAFGTAVILLLPYFMNR